jgi:hypothetical protein
MQKMDCELECEAEAVMTEERKLTFRFVGSIIISILFFYFSWSASRWTEHVESSLVSLQSVDAQQGPRISTVEIEVKNLRQSDSDLKLAVERLNDKLDRIIEMLTKRFVDKP